MREYKFRAPHPDTGKLYYFQFYPTWGSDVGGPPAWDNNWAETVEQYTGLKDKNGKEIYEGDIVYNHWTRRDGEKLGSKWVVKFGEYDNSDLEYGSPALGFYGDNGGNQEGVNNLPTDEPRNKNIEVIGNIYENPELLEEKK